MMVDRVHWRPFTSAVLAAGLCRDDVADTASTRLFMISSWGRFLDVDTFLTGHIKAKIN